MGFFLVFLGGGLGSVARYALNMLAIRLWDHVLPIGTLSVNVLGSFAMGAVAEYVAIRVGLSAQLRLFLATGVLGGFTTFSTFSLDVASLSARSGPVLAGGYVLAS